MRKKIFATLMSVAMVASFMPSLAFAGTAAHTHRYEIVDTTATRTVTVAQVKTALKGDNANSVNVVKAATCTEDGVAVLTCLENDCDEAYADHTIEVAITGSHDTKAKKFSAKELADQLVKQYDKDATTPANTGWTQEQADEFVKAAATVNSGETYCYYEANFCSQCNKIVSSVAMPTTAPTSGAVTATNPIKAVDHFRDRTSGCNETAKCLECGQVVKVNGSHDAHVDSGKTVQVKAATCTAPAQIKKVCKNCGEAYDTEFADPNSKALGHNISAAKVAKTEACNGEILKGGYFSVTGTNEYGETTTDYYKYNATVTVKNPAAATCTTEYRGIKCATCGKFVKFGANRTTTKAALAGADSVYADNAAFTTAVDAEGSTVAYKIANNTHDYETKEVAATCMADAKTVKTCKKCGYKVETNKPNTQLAHNYVVTEVKGDCAHAGKVTVKCTTKGCTAAQDFTSEAQYTKSNHVVKTGNTYYFMGINDELSTGIALPTVNAGTVGHKFGALTKVKDATCTKPELWARKCTTCGKVDVSSAFTEKGEALGHKIEKVTVKPTCGTEGYTVEHCTVCDKYKNNTDGKFDVNKIDDESINKTNKVKALVKVGAAHKFDKWVVTKEATVFEERVKQLECSVCGTKDATKTIIAKKTVGAPEVKLVSKKGKLTVKASAADNATGYEVTYKRAGKKATTKTYTAESISKTYKLLKGKKYTVKVTAFASNGTDTVKGETVTKTITIKK